MTDETTPRNRDTELHQLRAQRAAANDRDSSAGMDAAAVMVIYPARRAQVLEQMNYRDAGTVTMLLAVIDRLTHDREGDVDLILLPVATRAAAALAVVHVPDTAAELLGDEPTA